MLTISPLTNTLYVKYNDQTYSLCEPFVDTENYTYDENGRLIGADERLWLKSDGGSYVDTGFIADNASRIYAKIYNDRTSCFFCSRQGQQNQSFGFLWTADNLIRTDYGKSQAYNIEATSGIYIIDKNKNVTNYTHPNGQTYTLTQNTQNFITPHTMLLMASYSTTNGGIGPANKYDHQRHYYFKIWSNGADENTLVRNMVPVPACMRIKDFIVPENGMWDTVEQKFYGNSGTGSFIYGRDE